MQFDKTEARILVALDFEEADQAITFARKISPSQCRVKVGKELFTRSGPEVVKKLVNMGYEVFLDLKFHDIPNTVARACRAAADLGVWMVNVHALGGRAMMESARNAMANLSNPPLLIAVTVLTSLNQEELAEIGFTGSLDTTVSRLAVMARDAGLNGVVCSAREAPQLRQIWGESACLVTPGIRPAGSVTHDQSRTMTPKEAIRAGSDYLVIGRPITESADPVAAINSINAEIASA